MLDKILGGMLGQLGGGLGNLGGTGSAGPTQGSNPLIQVLLLLLQQQGGLGGVLGRLRNAGLGAQADSWVGTGQNLPIGPDELSRAFGRDEIARAAQQAGMSEAEAEQGLSAALPGLVDQLTPQGQLPQDMDGLNAELGSLLGRIAR